VARRRLASFTVSRVMARPSSADPVEAPSSADPVEAAVIEPPAPGMRPRVAWGLVMAAVLLGTLLRFAGLESKSLWGDEIASLAVATGHVWMEVQAGTGILRDADHFRTSLSLAPRYFSQRLVAVLRTDTQAPLYYFLLNLWLHLFGTSETALRSLSLVVSVAAIPVLFVLGRRLASPDVGVVSALIGAVAPYQMAFGQYARPYALFLLLALLSTYAALRLTQGGNRWPDLLGYAGTAVAGLYTHYLFVWTIVFHWMLVVPSRRHDAGFLRRWLVIQIGIGAALLPWVPSLLAQLRWSREADLPTWFYWHAGALSFADTVLNQGRNIVLLLSVGRIRGLCGTTATGPCLADSIATGFLYLAAAAAIAFAAWKLVRHLRLPHGREHPRPEVWVVAVLWGLCIFAGPLAADWLMGARGTSIHRYYIAASGPLYLAVAAALVDIGDRRLRRVLVPAFLLVLLAGSVLYLRGFSSTLIAAQEVREVARHLDRAGHDGALIVVLNPLPHPLDLAYYLQSNPQFARITLPARSASASDISTQLQNVARARQRLWFLDDHGPEVEARAAVLAWLRAHYEQKQAMTFKGLDLFLFAR
jgi:uncharacterized membrane protein